MSNGERGGSLKYGHRFFAPTRNSGRVLCLVIVSVLAVLDPHMSAVPTKTGPFNPVAADGAHGSPGVVATELEKGVERL